MEKGNKNINGVLILLTLIISIIASIGTIFVYNNYFSDSKKKTTAAKSNNEENKSTNKEESNTTKKENLATINKEDSTYLLYSEFCNNHEEDTKDDYKCEKTIKVTANNNKVYTIVVEKDAKKQTNSITINNVKLDFHYSDSIIDMAFLSNGMFTIQYYNYNIFRYFIDYYDSNFKKITSISTLDYPYTNLTEKNYFDILSNSNVYYDCDRENAVKEDLSDRRIIKYNYSLNSDNTISSKKIYEYEYACETSFVD